ncbi:MAG TPA: HNH endonuclease [Candidatus Paceibacterota bacterium]|nr:HNH endonuclease [Candidatus Paceibacterota bacterium]
MTNKARKQRLLSLKRLEIEDLTERSLALLQKHGIQPMMSSLVIVELEKLAGIPIPKPGDPYSSLRFRLARSLVILGEKPPLRKETRNALERTNPELVEALVGIKILGKLDVVAGPPKPRGLGTPKIKADKAARFYESYSWRKLRYEVLKGFGRKCMLCGQDKGVFHVDHIKPLRKYWELRLVKENLQILCEECNHGKGNWDETDWRPNV